jgi:hypothetical protein
MINLLCGDIMDGGSSRNLSNACGILRGVTSYICGGGILDALLRVVVLGAASYRPVAGFGLAIHYQAWEGICTY